MSRPEAAIEFKDVTFAYDRARVLERVSLSVEPGERLGLLGPNGGGKTTLLKLTLGLLDGYSGSIRIHGRTPRQAQRERLIGYVPQRTDAELQFPLSVRQVAAMGVGFDVPAWRPLPDELTAQVDEALALVDMDALADRPIGRLSGGQLQRVMIARSLAARPRVLVLDEPLVGVDVSGQKKFSALLNTLHTDLHLTLIVVSHDIRTIVAGCDRVACLNRTLHSHGAPEGLTPAVLAEVFSHDIAGILGDLHVDAHFASECPDPSHHHDHDHAHDHVHESEPDGATPPTQSPKDGGHAHD